MLLQLLIAVSAFIGPPVNVTYKPVATKQNERLSAILKEWRTAEGGGRDVRKVLRRTYDDKTWRTKETMLIEILEKKPDLLRLEAKDANKKQLSLWVITGKHSHLFDFQTRSETNFQPPSGTPRSGLEDFQAAKDSFIDSLRRAGLLCFDVERLIQEYEPSLDGEDAHYCYLSFRLRKGIAPTSKFSLSWFFTPPKMQQIALLKKDHLPRQIRVHESDGNVTTLETLKLEINVTPPVSAESIEANLPTGWSKGK
jgi:outer membrane lipoprotein-sorting protein